MSVGDAQAMFDLGAVAVQLYTGFIYSGPGLVADINTRTRREE
jgi:dihydroorotate dehydrogenase